MPSSSGPRYVIWLHMWRTRASVMLLSRVALTTPAIPHMAFPSASKKYVQLSYCANSPLVPIPPARLVFALEPQWQIPRFACLPFPSLHTSGTPAHKYASTDTLASTNRRYRASGFPDSSADSPEKHDAPSPPPDAPQPALSSRPVACCKKPAPQLSECCAAFPVSSCACSAARNR